LVVTSRAGAIIGAVHAGWYSRVDQATAHWRYSTRANQTASVYKVTVSKKSAAAEHAAVADRFARKIVRILAGVPSARGG
jgi:hypothetical protein